MENISWIHFVILFLAAFRLTHLLVFDEISAFIRKPFMTIRNVEGDDGQITQHIEILGSGLRHFIGSLLSCYWCTGVWCSIFVVILYWCVPAAFPFLLILAVAGAAAIVETRLNL